MTQKIHLAIEPHEYKMIAHTLRNHRDMVHKLGINDLLKKDLLKDTHIVTTILEKSEVREKPITQQKGASHEGSTDCGTG